MARPKSDDKRNTILAAAVDVLAERGVWSTPTAAISKAAGVAEGTLFTYFATKEGLLNELYRALKHEMANTLLADFPQTADVRSQLHHLWQRYVQWGLAYPNKVKVLAQLQVSDQITPASKAVGYAPFVALEQLGAAIMADEQVHAYPVLFIAALLNSMAETTMAAIAQNDTDLDYSALGFEIFWRGIARS